MRPHVRLMYPSPANLYLCRPTSEATTGGRLVVPVSPRVGLAALAAFFLLLIGLPVLRDLGSFQSVALFEAFYRSGALVFGGGHVVLPLLREGFVTPGWVTEDSFLAGYGAALGLLCWVRCPSGIRFESARRRGPRCMGSTPLSWDCSVQHSTIRFGPVRSRLPPISLLH